MRNILTSLQDWTYSVSKFVVVRKYGLQSNALWEQYCGEFEWMGDHYWFTPTSLMRDFLECAHYFYKWSWYTEKDKFPAEGE